MELSIQIQDLKTYVSRQLNHFFPDNILIRSQDFDRAITIALDRTEFCFDKIILNSYRKKDQTQFNHLYSDQYLAFLWILSNTIWKEEENYHLASKIYYLNKSLHAFDCMFDTGLPDVFYISHGVGTMLGKGTYGNFFVAMQGCTIGANNGAYPILSNGVSLTAHSSVIGGCSIGECATISSYTNVFQKNVPANSLVFRNELGIMEVRQSSFPFIKKIFNMDLFKISSDGN